MRRTLAVTLLVIVACWPASSGAWGMQVHRLLTGLAIDGLPAPLRSLYASQRAFVVEHAVDPDLWRVVGLRGELGPEEPNHFLDIDALGEPAPFTGVPRDWDAYVARYGAAKAETFGRLPWRATEVYGRLVEAFKVMARGTSYGADNVRYLSAIMAHYVEDAHQPLHAAENYDGQLTNQRGVHSRFETELPLRNWSRIAHPPVQTKPIGDIKTFVFSTLVESNALVAPILAADRAAAAHLKKDANDRVIYDDGYYAGMYRDLRPLLQKRLADSTNGVASVLVAAWTEAGKPIGPAPQTRSPRP
ncbi:MAG: hypothetical protein ABI634_10250 [Acidobacteriota bacterium]